MCYGFFDWDARLRFGHLALDTGGTNILDGFGVKEMHATC